MFCTSKLENIFMRKVVNDKREIVAQYRTKEEDGIHIQTLTIPIEVFDMPLSLVRNFTNREIIPYDTVDLGFGKITASGQIHVLNKLIEPKVEKMTVAEIEKKLGYKIEIISEKERKNEDKCNNSNR